MGARGWLVVGTALQGVSWTLGQSVTLLNAIPLGHFYASAPGWGWLAAYYALAVLIAARKVLGLRVFHITVAALLLAAAFLTSGAIASHRHTELRVTVLDVGHGLSVFCEFPDGRNLLYDAGGMDGDAGEHVVAPFLWSEQVGRIDALVLSHPDADHINGVPALIERFAIGTVCVNEGFGESELGGRLLRILGERGLKVDELAAGARLVGYREVDVQVLSPVTRCLRKACSGRTIVRS